MEAVQKIYAKWIYVSDAEKSKQFYRQVFCVEPRFQDKGWLEFNLGETTFAILQHPKEKGAVIPEKTRTTFQVADIAEKETELHKLGVKIIQKREELYGILLTVEDPDGHWLEFYEPKEYQPNI